MVEVKMARKILPVIMCGGAGTRVWPESRETMPKQFIPLIGTASTFQQTIKRLDAQACEIKRMYVVPEARGTGVGRALLHELERRDGRYGLQAMCCGGGLGTGTLIDRSI